MPLEIIRPSILLVLVLIPWALDIFSLLPVARMEQPSSVPKNQYRIRDNNKDKDARYKIGILIEGNALYPAKGNNLVVFAEGQRLVCLFSHDTEIDGVESQLGQNSGQNRRNSHGRMEKDRSPDLPAMPARNATNRDIHTEWPLCIIIMHTAPPVAMVPSTVRSARSSTL